MSVRSPLPARKDRARVLVTPEGIALPITLASRGSRLGALVLDLMIVFGTLLLTAIVLGLSAAGLAKYLDALSKAAAKASGALELLAIVFFAGLFLLRYGYFLFFELGPRGATPGKRIVNIRVAARDGGRLSAEMVLARNLLRDIELFMPLAMMAQVGNADDQGALVWATLGWVLIFALFPFFNRDRLRAGDLIAGTWVVETPRRKLEAALSVGKAATIGRSHTTGADYHFSPQELALYGEYELQTLERVLRENRAEAISAVHAVICSKLGWDPGAGDERAFLEAYYTQLRARLESGMRMGTRKADKFG